MPFSHVVINPLFYVGELLRSSWLLSWYHAYVLTHATCDVPPIVVFVSFHDSLYDKPLIPNRIRMKQEIINKESTPLWYQASELWMLFAPVNHFFDIGHILVYWYVMDKWLKRPFHCPAFPDCELEAWGERWAMTPNHCKKQTIDKFKAVYCLTKWKAGPKQRTLIKASILALSWHHSYHAIISHCKHHSSEKCSWFWQSLTLQLI